tara:strand:+ start:854 stop:1006 length:153 start_codon:yes stop_codon:yes gene_type:complete
VKAREVIGSYAWGEGVEEVLDFGSYAIPQNSVILIKREDPSLFGLSVQQQ